MRTKQYTMGLVRNSGQNTVVKVRLEVEGKRAFVVWNAIRFGALELTSRMEIDPKRLQKADGRELDYFYCGALTLPKPENN